MIKDRWTGSIADGSGSFLEGISDKLGTLAKGRSILEKEGALQLHENMETYNAVFNSKKEDTGVLNAYFWDANSMITVS